MIIMYGNDRAPQISLSKMITMFRIDRVPQMNLSKIIIMLKINGVTQNTVYLTAVIRCYCLLSLARCDHT